MGAVDEIFNPKSPDSIVIRVSRQGTQYKQKVDTQDSTLSSGYTQTYQDSDHKTVILDKSAAQVLDQINERLRSPWYSLYSGILTAVLLFLSLWHAFFLLLAIGTTVATYIIYTKDVIRKTTPLTYEFEDQDSKVFFSQLSKSITQLSSSKKIWRLKSQISTDDWKRNAGSQSIIVRQISKVGKTSPHLLEVNLIVWGIDAGEIKIYLLPDVVFILQRGVYTTVDYKDVRLDFSQFEYVEQESVCNDSTVIGHKWKYVRRDGGADKRFKGNRKLPIVRYGLVNFKSSKLSIYLITSSLEVGSTFRKLMLQALKLDDLASLSSKTISSLGNSDASILEVDKDIPVRNLSDRTYSILEKAVATTNLISTSQVAELLDVSTTFVLKHKNSFDHKGYRFTRKGKVGRQIGWQVSRL